MNLILKLKSLGLVKAVAHITGGGMENLPRVLPKGTEVKLVDWAWPEAFIEVQERAKLTREEMLQTLNCGVGLALVCSAKDLTQVEAVIKEFGYGSYQLGRVDQSSKPTMNGALPDAQVVY